MSEKTSKSSKRGRPPTKWKDDVIEITKNMYGLFELSNGLVEALKIHMYGKALIEKNPITQVNFTGCLKSNVMEDSDIRKFFEAKGLALLLQNLDTPAPESLYAGDINKTNVVSDAIFYDDKNIINFYREPFGDGDTTGSDNPDHIRITLESANDYGYSVAAEFMSEFTKTPELLRKKGCIHVLMRNQQEMEFAQAGFSSAPFVKRNYPEEITRGFTNIVRALTEENPVGRLTILNGPTGSGKTYFIRALMDAVPNGFFVFVTTNLVESLGGPALVKAFLNHKNEIGGSQEPLILIVEDADSCMKRDVNSMNSLSSLLNISDGLLGECLDIRVITTTNAKTPEIAPALLRSGRLVEHLSFGPLSPGHVNDIYMHLSGQSLATHDHKETLLSDIYQLWRKNHLQPVEKVAPTPVFREGQYSIRARRKAQAVLLSDQKSAEE